MDRVFRISKLTAAFEKERWHLKKKYVLDNEADYKRLWKTYKRLVDKSIGNTISVQIIGEEFVNGVWILLETYPEK